MGKHSFCFAKSVYW